MDERVVPKTEGKTNFSRRLKEFDGLTRLTPTRLIFLRQIDASDALIDRAGRHKCAIQYKYKYAVQSVGTGTQSISSTPRAPT